MYPLLTKKLRAIVCKKKLEILLNKNSLAANYHSIILGNTLLHLYVDILVISSFSINTFK